MLIQSLKRGEDKMASDISIGERKLLSYIRNRAGFHMGTKNLVYLEHYIHGYDMALYFHGIKKSSIIPEGMQEYVEKKYGFLDRTAANYFSIIIKNSTDEKEAFDNFFDLLDDYLTSIQCEQLPNWDNSEESKKQILELLSHNKPE